MVFRFVGDKLASLTATYSEAASSNLATDIVPIALSAVTLFISVYGALVIAGKIQQPFTDFMMKAGKILLIAAVCLNAANYMAWVADAVTGLESGLVTALRAPGTPAGATSTYEQLDKSIGKAMDLVGKCFDNSAKKSLWTETGQVIGWNIAGLIIAVGIVIFFLVGGATIVATKFLLAIMIGIGPLFVLALMFPATAGFFDRWLGQTLTYVFTIVLVTVVMSLGITIFDTIINDTALTDDGALFKAVQILFVSLILAFVTKQINGLAAGIAGGASMAALTLRDVAGIATSPAKAATSAGKMANPTSSRLDPNTGKQVEASRAEHMRKGRTALNPAYNRAVKEHRKDNATSSSWGRGSNKVEKAPEGKS